jgi:hypothetical protein
MTEFDELCKTFNNYTVVAILASECNLKPNARVRTRKIEVHTTIFLEWEDETVYYVHVDDRSLRTTSLVEALQFYSGE